MTYLPLILYTAFAALATLALLTVMIFGALRRQRARGRDEALRALYLQIVMQALVSGEERQSFLFPQLRRPGARLLLAETVAGVVAVMYGVDLKPLRRIIARNGIDDWLLGRIRRARGFRRARYLSLLVHLPVDGAVAAHAAQYARSRNRYVRFYALLAQLAADSSVALPLIAEYPAPFSTGEVAEIMALLRRGMLPIAYEPLIGSPYANLRRVGLGIIRQFGIEEAENRLLRMVASDGDPDLWRGALYTLCTLRRPLTHRAVVKRVALMGAMERKALLRYMALEGYAPEAMRRLFSVVEQPYYESLVQSYKRCLV